MARIRVVDDVKFVSQMVADIFEKRGHEVLVATSGAQALALANRHTPDLVLLDIAMPRMDGIEVARQLLRDLLIERGLGR